MIRVALESILGLTERQGRVFVLRPQIPDDWPGFRIERRLPEGTVYEFDVVHPEGPAEVVVRVTLDGRDLAPEGDAAVVPIERDGKRHRVAVEMGARAGRAAASGVAR
jgi:cyclic beta-1,2-glucan synthetase